MRRCIAPLLFSLAFATVLAGQTLPSKINGYKVHEAKVKVFVSDDSQVVPADADATVRISSIIFADFGLSGLTAEIAAEITSLKADLKVDRVTFHDVTINGYRIAVEDYSHSFNARKDESVFLPKPARILIRPTQIPFAAYNELVNSPKTMTVKGTAFVFGKFKRFGFSFKRVVPVKLDLEFKNPLRRG